MISPLQATTLFDMTTVIYLMILVVVVFSLLIAALLWFYRGAPTTLAKANFQKKDILLVNMANNRFLAFIPKVIQGHYFLKGNKSLDSINGFFKINNKGVVPFSNTHMSIANSHQSMTHTPNSLELMSKLQKEDTLGIKINKYDDIDVIIKYGEAVSKGGDINVDLKIRFMSLVEQMSDLEHLRVVTEDVVGEGVPRTEIFSKKDKVRLIQLIDRSKVENDSLNDVTKEDLELLARAESQMVRGETTNLRSIRGFFDGDMIIPTPKTVSVLVQNAVSKMTKMNDMMKPLMFIVGSIVFAGLAGAVIFYIITGQA